MFVKQNTGRTFSYIKIKRNTIQQRNIPHQFAQYICVDICLIYIYIRRHAIALGAQCAANYKHFPKKTQRETEPPYATSTQIKNVSSSSSHCSTISNKTLFRWWCWMAAHQTRTPKSTHSTNHTRSIYCMYKVLR